MRDRAIRLPVREVCAWARERGIATLVDGPRPSARFPSTSERSGCDCYAGNGHKWLGGPKRSGIFWRRPKVMAGLAPVHVGAGTFRTAEPRRRARSSARNGRAFEYGTRNHLVSIGLHASLRWFDSLGWPAVFEHIAGQAAYLKERLMALKGVRLLTPSEREASVGPGHLLAARARPPAAAESPGGAPIHHRGIPPLRRIRISPRTSPHAGDVDALIAASRAREADATAPAPAHPPPNTSAPDPSAPRPGPKGTAPRTPRTPCIRPPGVEHA